MMCWIFWLWKCGMRGTFGVRIVRSSSIGASRFLLFWGIWIIVLFGFLVMRFGSGFFVFVLLLLVRLVVLRGLYLLRSVFCSFI